MDDVTCMAEDLEAPDALWSTSTSASSVERVFLVQGHNALLPKYVKEVSGSYSCPVVERLQASLLIRQVTYPLARWFFVILHRSSAVAPGNLILSHDGRATPGDSTRYGDPQRVTDVAGEAAWICAVSPSVVAVYAPGTEGLNEASGHGGEPPGCERLLSGCRRLPLPAPTRCWFVCYVRSRNFFSEACCSCFQPGIGLCPLKCCYRRDPQETGDIAGKGGRHFRFPGQALQTIGMAEGRVCSDACSAGWPKASRLSSPVTRVEGGRGEVARTGQSINTHLEYCWLLGTTPLAKSVESRAATGGRWLHCLRCICGVLARWTSGSTFCA